MLVFLIIYISFFFFIFFLFFLFFKSDRASLASLVETNTQLQQKIQESSIQHLQHVDNNLTTVDQKIAGISTEVRKLKKRMQDSSGGLLYEGGGCGGGGGDDDGGGGGGVTVTENLLEQLMKESNGREETVKQLHSQLTELTTAVTGGLKDLETEVLERIQHHVDELVVAVKNGEVAQRCAMRKKKNAIQIKK
jgi:hypothetical protein